MDNGLFLSTEILECLLHIHFVTGTERSQIEVAIARKAVAWGEP